MCWGNDRTLSSPYSWMLLTLWTPEPQRPSDTAAPLHSNNCNIIKVHLFEFCWVNSDIVSSETNTCRIFLPWVFHRRGYDLSCVFKTYYLLICYVLVCCRFCKPPHVKFKSTVWIYTTYTIHFEITISAFCHIKELYIENIPHKT